MPSRQRCFVVLSMIIGLGASSLLAACGSGSPAMSAAVSRNASQGGPSAPIASSTAIQVVVGPSVGDGEFYIASDKGYFQQEGLQVQLQQLEATSDKLLMIATNRFQFAGSGPDAALLNAFLRGVDVRVVATENQAGKGSGLVVRKDLFDSGALTSVAQLKGKTIGVAGLTSSHTYDITVLLKQVGLQESDVNYTTMPFPEMVVALANKSVDAVWTLEPFITAATDKGVGHALATSDQADPDYPGSVVYVSGNFLRQQPDAAGRFMTALLRAQRDYNKAFSQGDADLKRELVPIFVNHTTIKDPALYDKMQLNPRAPNGNVDQMRAGLGRFQDYLIAKGALTQKVNLDQAVDGQLMDYAVKRLGAASPEIPK